MTGRRIHVTDERLDIAKIKQAETGLIQALVELVMKNKEVTQETLVGYAGSQQHKENQSVVEAQRAERSETYGIFRDVFTKVWDGQGPLRTFSLGLLSMWTAKSATKAATQAVEELQTRSDSNWGQLLAVFHTTREALLNRVQAFNSAEKPVEIALLESLLQGVSLPNGEIAGVRVRGQGNGSDGYDLP